MLISIDQKNPNFLSISFPYRAHLVDAVKMLPGRTYNVKAKTWRVHVDHVDKVVDMLRPLGITPSPEVVTLLAKAAANRFNASLEEQKEDFGSLPLFDFQRLGATKMRRSGALLLADVPGLGKSIQTIAALAGLQRVLILCPASLKFSWAKEIEKWTPEVGPGSVTINMIHGAGEDRKKKWGMGKANVGPTWYIANYELLYHDYDEIKEVGLWDAIVCDEATRISNPKAVTVRALKTLACHKRVALTGTPISNSPIDLWSILDWLRPGSLGNFTWFVERFAVVDSFRNISGFKNLREFSDLAAPWVLRRTKEEVLKDFPPKTIETIEFDLTEKEREIYEKIRQDIAHEIEGELAVSTANLGIIPVKMLRLKQLTDHIRLIMGDGCAFMDSAKWEALVDLITPVIQSGEKAIIFSQFAEMAKMLHLALGKHVGSPPVHLIYGDTPVDERQKLVDEFNKTVGGAIMVMTEAGAYGLNIQAASYVVHYDMPWSIAKLMQREDRAHRIGQTKPVTVYNLVAKNTIDEYVAKTLHKKQKVSVDLLKDAERMEKMGMSVEDIKNILRL